MSFRITGLSPAPFAHLFGLPEAELARHGVQRYLTQADDGFPDRVELRDSQAGDSFLLLNYEHQPHDTPYRARHAIFVREHAAQAFDAVNQVPEVLRTRLLSLRAFNAEHHMIDADVVDGREVEGLIERLLANPQVAYIQAHFARRGCFAATIHRH